ncbi:site-specific integrase [Spiroplasma endosymbiont of Aspidapion aeneum]|uniref:tyrosine-type recombinase/integrase n=1 Tax=Spiroplasma endosymbiont of Aspidapion aeneum TaxID=3066276 RepID=UPI00313BB596
MNQYILFLKKNQYSSNTILTYKSVLGIYKNEMYDIRNIKNKLITYYKNPNTVWTHYNIICSYMRWSNDARIKQLKQLKLPKIPKIYMSIFDKKFLMKKTKVFQHDSAQLKNKKLLVKFMFETGLRAAEVNKIISINKNIITLIGKGNKIRDVFHNSKTTFKINFKEITTKTLRLWVKEVLGKNFTPHSIRRSFATHMLLKGANPKMVMLQLGHEKVETTFRYLQLSMYQNKKIYDDFF